MAHIENISVINWEIGIYIVGVFLLGYWLMPSREYREGNIRFDKACERHASWARFTDAQEAYLKWFRLNPNETLLHPEAQRLLQLKIKAHAEYLKLHPEAKKEETLGLVLETPET